MKPPPLISMVGVSLWNADHITALYYYTANINVKSNWIIDNIFLLIHQIIYYLLVIPLIQNNVNYNAAQIILKQKIKERNSRDGEDILERLSEGL